MNVQGLFVRIPVAQAKQLDAACARLGTTKQALVRAMLETRLSDNEAETDLLSAPDSVLEFEQLVGLLRVDAELVRERVEGGEIPGRRFGQEWRFSRRAVFDWLSGSDVDLGRGAGFAVAVGGRRHASKSPVNE